MITCPRIPKIGTQEAFINCYVESKCSYKQNQSSYAKICKQNQWCYFALAQSLNKKLVTQLLLYHEASNTKTMQKRIFPEVLQNQIIVNNQLAFGRETL